MKINEKTFEKMPPKLQILFNFIPNDCPIFLLNQQVGIKKSGLLKAGHPYGLGDGQNVYGALTGKTQSDTHADQGYVSRYFKNLPPDTNRFFYSPKASRSERNKGCEDLNDVDGGHYRQDEWSRKHMGNTPDEKRKAVKNNHPTVKSLALMKYLVSLVKSPTKGIILDPFGGSGTTAVACEQLGIPYIIIEKEPDYCEIIKCRIKAANDPEPIKKTKKPPKPKTNQQPGLFPQEQIDEWCEIK